MIKCRSSNALKNPERGKPKATKIQILIDGAQKTEITYGCDFFGLGQYYVHVKENNVQFAEDYKLSTFCLEKDMEETFTSVHFLPGT